MFKTFIGPTEEKAGVAYFASQKPPRRCYFKNVLDTTRKKLPFGIAQIGNAFRNEITRPQFHFSERVNLNKWKSSILYAKTKWESAI